MKGRARRAAVLAFIWHTAELLVVCGLLVEQLTLIIAVLFAWSLIGWGWSVGHLPGRLRLAEADPPR